MTGRDHFSHLIGNERIKKKLVYALQKGTFAQGLCFQGIEGIGKSLFAKAFARALLAKDCPALMEKDIFNFTHPDIIEMRPVGKLGLHSIDEVRRFSDEVYIAPFEAKRKVMIIHEAERMLPTSANALLKTLEEPAPGVMIILLTSARDELLPTIRSRVQTLYFEPIAREKIVRFLLSKGVLEADAEMQSYEAQGSLKRLFQEKDPALHLIEQLIEKNLNYVELKRYLNTLESALSGKKNAFEEDALTKAKEPYKDTDLTARQKSEIEKQVEGLTAVEMTQDSKGFLLSILHFFRDLHVIYHGGQESFLVHRHLASKMFDAATCKEPIALERVEEAVAEALKSLERSTPLSSCIENLFLRLSLV